MQRNREVVHTRTVKCVGDDEWEGHPTVYYTMGDDEFEVTCMYCNKIFIYEQAD